MDDLEKKYNHPIVYGYLVSTLWLLGVAALIEACQEYVNWFMKTYRIENVPVYERDLVLKMQERLDALKAGKDA